MNLHGGNPIHINLNVRKKLDKVLMGGKFAEQTVVNPTAFQQCHHLIVQMQLRQWRVDLLPVLCPAQQIIDGNPIEVCQRDKIAMIDFLTSKLEKLNRELEKSEKKLRKAMNDEKALQHQLKQLTRKERTHRLCTRGGMLESFLQETERLTDDDVCLLYTSTTNTTANCLFMSAFCLMSLRTSDRYPDLIN